MSAAVDERDLAADLAVDADEIATAGVLTLAAGEPSRAFGLDRDDLRRIVRRGLLAFSAFVVGFLVFLLFASALPHARAQAGLQRRFEAELANAVAPVNDPIATGAPVAALTIPALGVHEVVVEGTKSAQLAKGPGHLRSSALPGQPGTSIILCRRLAFGAPCRNLDQLERGNRIVTTTGQGTVTYAVVGIERAAADDARVFDRAGSTLVLVTMDPPLLGSTRLVVRAEPVGDLQPRGTRAPAAPLRIDDLGLAGDRSAAGVLLVWLEVLVLLACTAVLLFRRWARWPAYLVSVPPLLACTWLVYEQLARLLPATI